MPSKLVMVLTFCYCSLDRSIYNPSVCCRDRDESIYDQTSCDMHQVVSRENDLCTIPLNLANISLFALDCMNHGSTVIRLDSDGSSLGAFILSIDTNVQTLLWTRSSWSSLGRVISSNADFAFKGECDAATSALLAMHYRIGLPVTVEESGQGCVDLMALKDVRVGWSGSADGSSSSDEAQWPSEKLLSLVLVFGAGIADNRTVEFLMPSSQLNIWHQGLESFVQAVRLFNRSNFNRRVLWLQDQYLRGFSDTARCKGPTPADAIKVFWFLG